MNCQLVDRGNAIEFANGRGFGHGVGLCQWGAQAKAARGWTAKQILSFYYPAQRFTAWTELGEEQRNPSSESGTRNT